MLQKKSVTKSLWNLLNTLMTSDVFNNYFLVGGTALSLQLGHRISEDIEINLTADYAKGADYGT